MFHFKLPLSTMHSSSRSWEHRQIPENMIRENMLSQNFGFNITASTPLVKDPFCRNAIAHHCSIKCFLNPFYSCQAHDVEILCQHTPEYLCAIRCLGFPNHKLKLKIGTRIMLMRILDQAEGLYNGTRLILTKMEDHVFEENIMLGKNIGNITYLTRMTMSPYESPWPFKLSRNQFPIIVSYTMTTNKSQGQSLDIVSLYLSRPIFSHGQLYVIMSRVKIKEGLKILVKYENEISGSTTTNIVFK